MKNYWKKSWPHLRTRRRSRCHNKTITWLKKTEYISTEFNRYGASSDKTETKLLSIPLFSYQFSYLLSLCSKIRVGYNVKKKMKEEALYLDRDSQIVAINKTFEAAQKPIIEHPGKPGRYTPWNITSVILISVYGNIHSLRLCLMQTPPPSPKWKRCLRRWSEELWMKVENNSWLTFCRLKTRLTKEKSMIWRDREYGDNEEYEYVMAREYNWNVKNKATKGYEENYFFSLERRLYLL